MTLPEALARITVLESELKRVKNQRNKAWCDRAEIHARLRAMTCREGDVPGGCENQGGNGALDGGSATMAGEKAAGRPGGTLAQG
jgi:hypothetical protein